MSSTHEDSYPGSADTKDPIMDVKRQVFSKMMNMIMLCIVVTAWSPLCGYGNEESQTAIYGLQRGDSLTYVRQQAVKYGFDIREETVLSEAGEELGLYLSREQEIVLIVVVFEQHVHWIDVLEKGVSLNGIMVGTTLFQYHQEQLPIRFLGHRDASLDDIVCWIGEVKTLIDWKYVSYIQQYEKTQTPNVLKHIVIKGIEL